MDIGLTLPHYGAEVRADRIEAWASMAESLGFSHLLVTDHLVAVPVYEQDFFECFATLSYLAAVTREIQIGTSVAVVPIRHPAQTARVVATIDQLSGGRVVFGVGPGASAAEFTALGLDFAERGPRTDEYLAAIVQLWTGLPVTFAGKYISLDQVVSIPTPVRPGGPPIWVGGASRPALRRAVEHGGTWHPTFPNPEIMATQQLPLLAELAERAGVSVPPVAPRLHLDITDRSVDGSDRELGVGSVEQIRDDIGTLADLGVSTIVFDPVRHWDRNHTSLPRSAADDHREFDQVRQAAEEFLEPAGLRVRG